MNRKQAFLDKYRLARTRRGIDPLAGLRHLERGISSASRCPSVSCAAT